MNKTDIMKQPPLAASIRTFHGDSPRGAVQSHLAQKLYFFLLRKSEKSMDAAHHPKSNLRLTHYPSGSLKLQQNYRETLRLTHQDDDLWQWALERKKQGLEQEKPWHKTIIFDWLRLLKFFSFLN